MGKKLWGHISSSSSHYRKYTNTDNKVYSLASACFQQLFHDRFSVRRYNSDLKKPEWTPLLLNSTKFVICQIAENYSLFQSLKMLPFHIRPEPFKLAYYSLIWNLSRYYFKIGTLCLFFLSSHVFPTLKFDRNYFVILLWKIQNPRDRNKTKPPIEKIFPKV